MNRHVTRLLLALAVLLAGTAVGASSAVAVDEQTTTEDDARVAFGDGEMRTERGGTVAVPVELAGTDTATVKIGSDDAVNYALVVTVADGDGDGAVTLSFDTDAAAEDGAANVTTRSDADGAEVESEVEHFGGTTPHPPLDAGTYPVELYEGTGDDRLFVAESRMVIEESPTTTAEPTTETTGTPTRSTTATTGTTTGTDGDVPGFGPVLAPLALAAAALLAARR